MRVKRTQKAAVARGILMLGTFLITAVTVSNCDLTSHRNKEAEYFTIQNMAILASVDYELLHTGMFAEYPHGDYLPRLPKYLLDAFYEISFATEQGLTPEPHKSIGQDLSAEHGVDLRWENSRFEAYDKQTGNNLHIYEQKDWRTINTLVSECNEWRKSEGRLACEFDGGSDYGMKPYTAILFNVMYLKYQGQKLGYGNGQYELVNEKGPAIILNADFLLSRDAIARVVSYQLLTQTSSLLAENFKRTGQKLPVNEWGWSPVGYDKKYYAEKLGEWQKFAKADLKTEIIFSKTGFEARNPQTGERITFPHDDDLLNEALKELNYYKEKCDFVNYFQIENYPMFLLSILRLYDVNLELDKATNNYVLALGPTDPKRFFEIVSEFTFVNDPSDTEYLKTHLTNWEIPEAPATDKHKGRGKAATKSSLEMNIFREPKKLDYIP